MSTRNAMRHNISLMIFASRIYTPTMILLQLIAYWNLYLMARGIQKR
jgi:cellulose biosynthesis protein BcsQ